jgi:hypothetical protein
VSSRDSFHARVCAAALFFILYYWRMCELLVIFKVGVVSWMVRAVLPLGQVMGLAEVSGVLRVVLCQG